MSLKTNTCIISSVNDNKVDIKIYDEPNKNCEGERIRHIVY